VSSRFARLAGAGYRALAVIFLLVYVAPLLTVGLVRLRQRATICQEVS